MQRVKTSTAVAALPADPAGGTPGYFAVPNPGGGVPATVPSYEWFNNMQEEVCAVIAAAGITLDGANRTQLLTAVQQLINAGGAIKAPVRATTTANIANLAGGAPNTLDGVALAANDRILVKDQTTGSQNGLYVVTTLGTGANGTWTRSTDADGAGEIVAGMLVAVAEGTLYADSLWELSTDGAITVGTTALTFLKKDVSAKQIQPISASVAGNALTISASALSLDFRSTTLGSGAVTTVSGTPANLVISSGSTLGTVSGQASRIAVLALNNAGTIELAAVNIAGGIDLSETGLISTTAEGGAGAADSATVAYSTTARASLAYRVLGYIESTQAAAGTWATAPSTIQGQGGQALAAMSSLGYGQTWQNVIGSRAINTTYYNTTGKPIAVSVGITSAATAGLYLTIGGVLIRATEVAGAGNAGVFGIVPPGVSYSATSAATLNTWAELR